MRYKETHVKLPDIDLGIITLSGYFKKHFELCLELNNQREAWDKLEDMYFMLMKRYRYSSYEAFRAAKSRYYKDPNNR